MPLGPRCDSSPIPTLSPAAQLLAISLRSCTPPPLSWQETAHPPSSAVMTVWRSLGVAAAELRVGPTLECGQCFGWAQNHGGATDEWVGVVGRHVIGLRQHPREGAQARCYTSPRHDVTRELRAYFQLDVPLAPLYRRWGGDDARMKVPHSLQWCQIYHCRRGPSSTKSNIPAKFIPSLEGYLCGNDCLELCAPLLLLRLT